jgi:hypothetical protein
LRTRSVWPISSPPKVADHEGSLYMRAFVESAISTASPFT